MRHEDLVKSKEKFSGAVNSARDDKFKVVHLNAQSVRNKQLELEVFINDELDGVDVFCITEHFLAECEIDYFTLENFKLISHFSRQKSRGGSLIMCRNGVQSSSILEVADISEANVCEIAAVLVESQRIQVVAVYRPPGANFDLFMELMTRVLEICSSTGYDTVISGDFNVLFNSREENFLVLRDLMQSFGFEFTIFDPTRNERCIDNIFINFSRWRNSLSCVSDPGLSDHGAVVISVDKVPTVVELREYKLIQPITESGKVVFYNLVSGADWEFINSDRVGINEKFETFMSILSNALNVAFPLKNVCASGGIVGNDYLNWFSSDLKRQRETLRFLHDLYKSFSDMPEVVEAFKVSKRVYKRNIEKAKRQHYIEQIHKAGNKNLVYWDLINKHRPKKHGIADNCHLDVNELNSFFINVADDIKLNIPDVNVSYDDYFPRDGISLGGPFSFKHATFIEVRDVIKNLARKKSRDHYGLNIPLIRGVVEVLVYPLTKLINMSIDAGIYPDTLKITKVIPVHKRGPRSDMKNYRPIALVPTISKIYETILKKQMADHFEDHDMFFKGQYGFRKNRSTTDAIMALLDWVVEGMERGHIVGSQFYDLSKAFDCVSHSRLVDKLRFYNFDAKSCSLLRSYLTERVQYVHLNGRSSGHGGVVSGVPQGSVLGPILYLIYVNDLWRAIEGANLLLFADDTAIVKSHLDEDALVECLGGWRSRLAEWFCANDLSLNLDKTSEIFFTHRNTEVQNSHVCVKYLGVTLDSALNWEGHVDALTGKIAKNIYLLRQLAKILPIGAVLTAYFSLIESHLRYALLAWGHSPHAKRLFALQRRAVRVVAHKGYREDVKASFVALGILTLPCLYIYHCLVLAKQSDNSHVLHSDIHDYDTRSNHSICLDFYRLASSRYSGNYYSQKFFNRLPRFITTLPLKKFKARIRSWLVLRSYYSFHEFVTDPGLLEM